MPPSSYMVLEAPRAGLDLSEVPEAGLKEAEVPNSGLHEAEVTEASLSSFEVHFLAFSFTAMYLKPLVHRAGACKVGDVGDQILRRLRQPQFSNLGCWTESTSDLRGC